MLIGMTQIKNLKHGQNIVIDMNGTTVTVGFVRTRNGKSIIFCVGWISPVMNATDMVMVV